MTLEERREVQKILRLLRNGSCWCGVGIGNPMMKQHSEGCMEAQKWMAGEVVTRDEDEVGG